MLKKIKGFTIALLALSGSMGASVAFATYDPPSCSVIKGVEICIWCPTAGGPCKITKTPVNQIQ